MHFTADLDEKPISHDARESLPEEHPAAADGVSQEQHPTMDEPPMSQERLREICWELGAHFPSRFKGEHIALTVTHPHQGYLHWHVREDALAQLRDNLGAAFHHCRTVVRMYDVTDVIFDGLNAHSFFDIDVGLTGNFYLNIPQTERTWVAEIGFLLRDNSFHAAARSHAITFDRSRPSNRVSLMAGYQGKPLTQPIPVPSIYDSWIYERLNQELADCRRQNPLTLAMVYIGDATLAGQLQGMIDKLTKLADVYPFIHHVDMPDVSPSQFKSEVEKQAEALARELIEAHRERAFELLHAHDWFAGLVALYTQDETGVPFVLTLHSTETDRAGEDSNTLASRNIQAWEKKAGAAALHVIGTRDHHFDQLVIGYGMASDKVSIIPDVFHDRTTGLPDPTEAKRRLCLNPDWPVGLYAGEISHAGGADLLMHAMVEVGHERGDAQLVFCGEGPLKGELEHWAHNAGVGHRVRFVGDVPGDYFENIMLAADFVVIPARSRQDQGLAHMAMAFGKPVLTTHQAGIHGIKHGENGLVTFDNPGSMVWGLKEMLANPMRGNMLRFLAQRDAQERTHSLESVVVELYITYEHALKQGA